MNSRLQEQSLALAGVAQFALYAHELATEGHDRPARMDIARRIILHTGTDEVMTLYGDLSTVNDGMAFLKGQLRGRNAEPQTARVAQYMGQLLRLAGRLRRDNNAQQQLWGVIERAQLVDTDDVDIILADGYQTVISPMKPRIMLRGQPGYLENPALQARARTLLMAGIRCGYAWRQYGGHFTTLLLRRKTLLQALGKAGVDS